ncbi:MAG: DNA replication/repair protein RecF [Cyclobacteriaceae bacterium]|nr:DNA replication/repair protein RecF [Cyclobacteriaceae bacterium]MCH8517271.1 DNA replication/repair protein RecF [Cyclobacteriaceae bacterium]
MHLQNISLTFFKNYDSLKIDFSNELNAIIGPNGSGKTNLLDAIYYLSLSKSAFVKIDKYNIKQEEQYFNIKGDFSGATADIEIQCNFQLGKGKLLMADRKPYEKQSDHIGRFPAVMIAPDDISIINGGSEERRKFFDGIICQVDAEYLRQLIRYNKLIKQRNAYLKYFSDRGSVDKTLIATYDEELVTLAVYIYAARKHFIASYLPIFNDFYIELSLEREQVSLSYESVVAEPSYHQRFKASFAADLREGRTIMGIHKDDYLFHIGERLIRKTGSQGQKKTYLLALKLAQFVFIKQKKNLAPILLLDDIFDRLDDERIQKLLRILNSERTGQVFITDARPERSRKFFEALDANKKFIHIKEGSIQENMSGYYE